MEKFEGKWEAFESEGQDALFEIFDLPEQVRQMMKSGKTIHTLKRDGDDWMVKMDIEGHGNEVRMKLGEEFTDLAPSGDPYKATVTWDGSKFVGKARFDKKGIDATIERRMDGDKMVVGLTAKGKSTAQYFKKIE